MKKIMSLLLCVMLVVTMMPAIAWAEGENIGGGETVPEEFTRWTIVYSETLLEEDDYPATYGDVSIHMNLKATGEESSVHGYLYAAKFSQIKGENILDTAQIEEVQALTTENFTTGHEALTISKASDELNSTNYYSIEFNANTYGTAIDGKLDSWIRPEMNGYDFIKYKVYIREAIDPYMHFVPINRLDDSNRKVC